MMSLSTMRTHMMLRMINRIGIQLKRLRFSSRNLNAKYGIVGDVKAKPRPIGGAPSVYYRIWLCPGRHCPYAIADSHDKLLSSLTRTVAFSPSLYASRLRPARTPPPRLRRSDNTQPRTTQFRSANETTAADEIGHFDEKQTDLKKK